MASANHLIRYFGGVSHCAKIIGVSRMCLYKWMRKGDNWQGVPHKFRTQIRKYVTQNNIDFVESDFDDTTRIGAIMQNALDKIRTRSTCALCENECNHPVPQHKVPWQVKQ